MELVAYPLPIAGQYDRLCAENEVAAEMPSLVCVLSGRLMRRVTQYLDCYSYEEEHADRYIKANGKRVRDVKVYEARSPRTDACIICAGSANDSLRAVISETVARKEAEFNCVDGWGQDQVRLTVGRLGLRGTAELAVAQDMPSCVCVC
jgi:hypothetical protein